MGRKHKHPEHENLERWVVSYADFMTLLFATFTALFALAKAESHQEQEKILEQLRTGFNNVDQSVIQGVKSVLSGESGSESSAIDQNSGASDGVMGDFKSMTWSPGEVEAFEETIRQMMTYLEDANAKIDEENKQQETTSPPDIGEPSKEVAKVRPIEVTAQTRGIKVSFDSRFLFYSGSAALKPGAGEELAKVAERLRELNETNLIQVEGHTDNIPISTAVYPSNWELSTARASAVVRYLIKKEKFNPIYLSAVGFADSRPIDTNKTKAGREKNRRIDIIVYSKQASAETDPKDQHEHKIKPLHRKPIKDHPISLDSQLIESFSSGGDSVPLRIKYVDSGKPNALVPKIIDPSSPSGNAGQVVKPIEILPNHSSPPEPEDHS